MDRHKRHVLVGHALYQLREHFGDSSGTGQTGAAENGGVGGGGPPTDLSANNYSRTSLVWRDLERELVEVLSSSFARLSGDGEEIGTASIVLTCSLKLERRDLWGRDSPILNSVMYRWVSTGSKLTLMAYLLPLCPNKRFNYKAYCYEHGVRTSVRLSECFGTAQ